MSDPEEGEETRDIAALRKVIRAGSLGAHAHVALLGLKSSEVASVLKQVESGLPYSAFVRFRRNAALPLDQLSKLVRIPVRTLSRRSVTKRLTPEESDRLLRASRVFVQALALFEGDVASARAWLSTPTPALDDRSPQDVASTEVGAREVEKLIGRLEHGVFS